MNAPLGALCPPWCTEPAGHVEQNKAHHRPLIDVQTCAESLGLHVSLMGDAEREFVGLAVTDRWSSTPARTVNYEIAADIAEALGLLLLSLNRGDTLRLGESLLQAGSILGEDEC